MKKKPTVFLIILILFTLPFKILAYDAYTSHPNLTGIAVDFYNLYSSEKITETEKQLIMKGSSEEDNGLRFVNHFYDPVFNKTWRFLGIQYLFPELTAKQWAKNPFVQAIYDPMYLAGVGPIIKSPVFSNTNYTWQRAIYEYVKGNRIKAFESLGHILHLIQDMSVPEHTRENVHLFFLDKATSYYENYTARKEESFYQPLKNELNALRQFPLKNNLDNYFDAIALYSNNYFLSPDTLPPSKYKLPQVEYQDVPEINKNGEIEYFLLGIDEKGDLFHLAKKNYLDWRLQSGFTGYTLNDSKVLDDYFKRLGLKSVLTSAGVIDLYFKEIGKAKLDPNFVKKNEKNLIASIFGGIDSFISDIFQKEPDYILKESDISTSESTIVASNSQPAANLPTTSTSLKPTTTILKSSTTTKAPSKSTTTTKTTATTKSTTTTIKTTTTTKSTITTKSTTTTIPLTSLCPFNTAQSPLRNKVILNEIAWMGTTENSNHEWIELKNISNQTIDISNWQILDKDNQIKIILPLNTKILSNQLFLLERTDDDSVPQIKADYIFIGSINNQNETLKLFDNHCQLQDEAVSEGDWFFGDNASKRTMERKNDLTWQTSSEINGTPKRENSAGYFVNGGGSNSDSDSDSSSVSTTTTAPFASTTTTKPISYPKILINEIKIAGKNSNGEIVVKDEFVELYNPNNFSVDLTSWYLQKKTKESSDYSSLITKSVLEGKTINPKNYLVIGNILSPSSSSYDALWSDDYSLAKDNTLILKNPLGEIVDKVGWGEVLESENVATVNPEPQQSLQRKKISDEPIDTNNNQEDFEVLDCPTPNEISESCVLGETTENETLNPYIKNFSWHYFDETKSKIVIEFDIDGFPFINNTPTTDNQFFALAFYLNQEVPINQNNIKDTYLGDKYLWELDSNTLGLVLKYPDCQGYEGLKGSLIFTSDDDYCHSPGAPKGWSYRLDRLPQDNHFIIEVTGTTQNRSFSNFNSADYLTIGFYGHILSYLRLIYPDNHHYHFEPNHFYHFPEKGENFFASFKEGEILTSTSDSSSTLYFSFDEGIDEDLNDRLSYEIVYIAKEENESLENNRLLKQPAAGWPFISMSAGNWSFDSSQKQFKVSFPLSSLSYLNLPVETPTTFYFALRIKDKVGLFSPLSELKELTILPPPPPPQILNSFLQNIHWYFDNDNQAKVEFDIVLNGKVPSNYINYKYRIYAGLDYEEGAGFAYDILSPTRIFIYPRRANRVISSGNLRAQDIKELVLFSQNQKPSLTHYKISPFNICLPQDNSFSWQCFENNKEIILNELSKRNKSLTDLYLFLAYGVCDSGEYGCVWFNFDDLSNPPVFYLNTQH